MFREELQSTAEQKMDAAIRSGYYVVCFLGWHLLEPVFFFFFLAS